MITKLIASFLFSFALLLTSGCFGQENITIYHQNNLITLNSENQLEVGFSENEIINGYAFRIIIFNDLINVNKSELLTNGIELLDYLPKDAYYAKISVSNALASNTNILGCFKILPEWRLSVDVTNSINSDDLVELEASFFDGERDNVIAQLSSLNGVIITAESPSSLTITLSANLITELSQFENISFIAPASEKSTPVNLPGKTSHGSNYLDGYNGSAINYTGNGITVLMTDDGLIGEHIDFKGRYDQSGCGTCSSDPADTHGDHVAGTIMGAGNLNPIMQGMAVDINFFVQNAASGFGAFWNVVPNMYNNDSLVLTSRSYRNGCGGAYTSVSNSMDEQLRLFPNLMHVCAAANEGTQDCGYGVTGWGNISDEQQAGKNPLVVGAVDRYNNIAGFSSRGPLADGRLKPDICGVGVAVSSTVPDNSYDSWDGTSMSTPGVTGTLAQLYESFKDNNSGAYPAGALMKAIVMNSADDLGNKGPDFIYGYGKINGRKAYQTIANQTYFIDTISAGANESFFINVPPNVAELKVMLYWPDWEAPVAASYDLVNNLNLEIIDPNTNTYLPWVLDHSPSIPALSSPAVPGVDTLNNTEQITVDNPVSGTYEINVDGFSIPQGPQPYYIVYEYNFDEIFLAYPNGMEGLAPSSSEIIRWDAVTGTDDFFVEYTLDNGSSWNTIGTALATKRHLAWSTPSGVATGLARVRVTRGAASDMSDTTFSIISAPTNLSIDWACPDSLKFSWNEVVGATGYEVSLLGNKFMDVYDTVVVDSIIIQVPASDTVWLSVSTLGSNNAKSRRAIAIGKNPGEFNCTWSPPHAGISTLCDSIALSGCIQVMNESVNVDVNSTYLWYFPGGTPAMSTDENPTVCYSTSGFQDAALVVTNSAGSDSSYFTDYLYIQNSNQIPYYEGFESLSDFMGLDSWSVNNPDGNNAFQVTTTAALTGFKSARLSNYLQPIGSIDELISGPINLSVLDPATDIMTLSFRYAYRKRNASNDEWLRVLIVDECGSDWVVRKTLHGDQLSDLYQNSTWTPSTPDDWTTVHMTNITSAYFTEGFRFKFSFESDGGNNFFLDDINIYSGAPSDEIIVGMSENSSMNAFQIFPNPTDDELNVQFSLSSDEAVNITVVNILGRTIQHQQIKGVSGVNLVMMDTVNLAPGTYFITIETNGAETTEQFVVK